MNVRVYIISSDDIWNALYSRDYDDILMYWQVFHFSDANSPSSSGVKLSVKPSGLEIIWCKSCTLPSYNGGIIDLTWGYFPMNATQLSSFSREMSSARIPFRLVDHHIWKDSRFSSPWIPSQTLNLIFECFQFRSLSDIRRTYPQVKGHQIQKRKSNFIAKFATSRHSSIFTERIFATNPSLIKV